MSDTAYVRMVSPACAGLLAYVDQMEARIKDLDARERYWREQAVTQALYLMARDGEVRQRPDGKWELAGLPMATDRIRA